MAFSAGRRVLGEITSITYDGLLRLWYSVRIGRDAAGWPASAALSVRAEVDVAGSPPFVLVHNPDRIPLSVNDGQPVDVAPINNRGEFTAPPSKEDPILVDRRPTAEAKCGWATSASSPDGSGCSPISATRDGCADWRCSTRRCAALRLTGSAALMPIYVLGPRNPSVAIPNQALTVSISGSLHAASLVVHAADEPATVQPNSHLAVLSKVSGPVSVTVVPADGADRFAAGTQVSLAIGHDSASDLDPVQVLFDPVDVSGDSG